MVTIPATQEAEIGGSCPVWVLDLFEKQTKTKQAGGMAQVQCLAIARPKMGTGGDKFLGIVR
jgi:hypothetical protein